MNIIEVLSDIQTKLKAPKGQYNSFGKYYYRSCEDILEALKPLLAEHKAAVQVSDRIIQVGERIYVEATASLHVGNDAISNTAFAREDETKKGMDGAQITGTSSSYARKYALNGLFAIDDTKDADATNTHGKTAAKVHAETASEGDSPTGAVCADCGSIIEDSFKRGGEPWSAYEIREYSIKRYGSSLCPACMRAREDAAKKAAKAEKDETTNN